MDPKIAMFANSMGENTMDTPSTEGGKPRTFGDMLDLALHLVANVRLPDWTDRGVSSVSFACHL